MSKGRGRTVAYHRLCKEKMSVSILGISRLEKFLFDPLENCNQPVLMVTDLDGQMVYGRFLYTLVIVPL